MNIKLKIGLGIIGFIAALFMIEYIGIVKYKLFAPMWEDSKREVFENTQSYVESKRQELSKYRLEYLRSEDSLDKETIRMMIVQTFSNVDHSKFRGENLNFLKAMINGKDYKF